MKYKPLPGMAGLDQWGLLVKAVSCPALQAQLSAIHGACTSAVNAAQARGADAEDLMQAVSPMLDPVTNVLAQ